MIEIPMAALRRCAADAGLSDAFMDRHTDDIVRFALRIAAWQRKKDQQRIRQWYFDQSPTKARLFEVLTDE